jgi:predicted transcriptional regulator
MGNKKSVDQHARLPASIIASDLTLRQFKVYAALSFFKGGNATCWPKIAKLCKMTNIDDRNLTRILKELEELGLIKRELRNIECQSTIYTLYEPDVEIFVDEDSSDLPASVATTLPAKLATTPPGQISRDIEQYSMNNTKEQKTITPLPPKGGMSEDSLFESFWNSYPRKVGKGQARKAFTAALKKADVQTIAAGFKTFLPSVEGKEERFIPHAATWLNGERWLDQPKQEQKINFF